MARARQLQLLLVMPIRDVRSREIVDYSFLADSKIVDSGFDGYAYLKSNSNTGNEKRKRKIKIGRHLAN